MYNTLKPDFAFCDMRGELVQLVHRGYQQVNVLKSHKGVTRGGHYHKQSTEAFYVVSGSVTVTFSALDGTGRQTHCFRKGSFFEIPPGTVHSMAFPEECTLIALYDTCVEHGDGTKDIYPYRT